MNDSYHKSVLYWPEPTIPISDLRYTITQSQYVKGTMGVLDMTAMRIAFLFAGDSH